MALINKEEFELGRTGGYVITATEGAVTGTFGALYAITEAQLSNFESSGRWEDATTDTNIEAATLAAGTWLLMPFTAITVSSGTVQVFNQ